MKTLYEYGGRAYLDMLMTWFMDAGVWETHLTESVQSPAPGEERWFKSVDQVVMAAKQSHAE